MRRGLSVEQVAEATKVDPWFLDQMAAITEERAHLAALGPDGVGRSDLRRAKRLGFSDAQLAWLWGITETEVRSLRLSMGIVPTY